MTLSQLLSSIGIAPKDLETARNVIEPAKATLDAVNALFVAAGLNLDQMLEAGPEALKAHIDSLSDSESELTDALARIERMEEQLTTTTNKAKSYSEAFDAVGFKFTEGGDLKAAFAEHVKKAAALELAKSGHPPVPHIEARASGASATEAEIHAQWKAMPAGPARLEFFRKNEVAIRRASGLPT